MGFSNHESPQFLLNRNAQINIPDKNGNLPLHDAVREGHITTIKLLLNKSSLNELHWKNNKGETPLGLAIVSHRADVIYQFEKKMRKEGDNKILIKFTHSFI